MSPPEGTSPDRLRQGAAPMVALSKPLTYLILDVLGEGPCPQSELLAAVAAARATCFRHLLELEELGVLTRWRRDGSRNAYCGLTEPAGQELLRLAELLLETFSSPQLPSAVADASVRVRGLAAAWNTTALRWLAEGPCSVRDLDTQAPSGIGLPEVEAAREAMLAGALICDRGAGRPRRFGLTDLGEDLARPAAAALRWQRRNLPDRGLPLTATEVETLMVLAARHLNLPESLSGKCGLAVDGFGGVHLEIERGAIADANVLEAEFSGPRLRGPVDAWLKALADGEVTDLSLSGTIPIEREIGDALATIDGGSTG
jgi:DNA-binding transcriptional ArsR family regulator